MEAIIEPLQIYTYQNGRFLLPIFGILFWIFLLFLAFKSNEGKNYEFILGFVFLCFILSFVFALSKDMYKHFYKKRPLIALFNEGVCYYDTDYKDLFYEWNKISNLIEKTGRSKELLFTYNGTENISIPKLTIEVADMKVKFEGFIAKSRLLPNTDQLFQCPALETIISRK